MDSIDNQDQGSPSMTAGDRLRTAREAAGLTRSDIASQTKVAERHLLAIEENRFSDLAARTYAVGFARTYARALGLDEAEIAAAVRQQLDAAEEDKPEVAPSFEPGDPARVPPVRVAWIAGAGAVVVIALLLVFWGNFLSPEGKLPDLLAKQTAAPPAAAPAAPAAKQPVDQTVVLTATDDNVWLSVKDEGGERLLEKTLANGESWTLPAEAQGPQLRTGRPDALQITVGGKAIPKLADKPQTVSGVSLAPAVLLARSSGTAPVATPAAAAPAPAVVAPTPAPPPAAPAPRPTASSQVPRATPTAATTPNAPRPTATQPRAAASTSGVLPSPAPNPGPRPSATTAVQPSPTGTAPGAGSLPSQPASAPAATGTVSTETE